MDDHIERYQFFQFQQGKQGLLHPYSGYLYEPVKVLHKLINRVIYFVSSQMILSF